MGIISAVTHLIERLRPVASPRYSKVLDTLATIDPESRTGNLSSWEESCHQIFDQVLNSYRTLALLETAEPHLFLMLKIFNFGTINLYCAFEQKYSEQEFQALLQLFEKYQVPKLTYDFKPDLSKW